MASVNKAIIIGCLGRDPEIRYMPSGDAIANLSVATTDTWKDKTTGEQKQSTEWHRISFFGRTAEVAGEYLKKGSQVYIEGSLRTRKYTDKDGVDKYTTEIRGDVLQMLGSRQSGGDDQDQSLRQQRPAQSAPATKATARPAPSFSDMDDDIPFLFDIRTIRDTMGASKQKIRSRYGKGVYCLQAMQADF